MSYSLDEFLKREVKKMLIGVKKQGEGNIFSLITTEVEKSIIQLVLDETDHNYVVSSKLLGISRSTLYRKIESLEIQKKE